MEVDLDDDSSINPFEDLQGSGWPDRDYSPNDQWYLLRSTLWSMLGYVHDPSALEKFDHMWRTDFDIATVEWPFMPPEAYLEPKVHISSRRVDP